MSTTTNITIQDCLLGEYVSACQAIGLGVDSSKVLDAPMKCEVVFTDDLDAAQLVTAQACLDDLFKIKVL